MINPMSLEGRRILVTGSSSGIGRQTAILLSNLGADITGVGRDSKRLQETLGMLGPGEHQMIEFDLCMFERYGELFKNIVEKGKKLDGMVHCAGIAKVIPLKVVSQYNMLEIMNINFFSFMELTKYYCKKSYSNRGSIVAVSAINAHYPQKCMSIYAASKGALEAAVTTLALELEPKGVRINSVVAGPIDTPMASGFDQMAGVISQLEGRQLLGLGKAGDVANVIAFLLSDASSYVTGRHYYVDGGRL